MRADATSRLIDPADYERYVAFTFAAADLVVEVDADHRVAYAAGAFRAHYGRDAEQCVGRPIDELVSPVDHELLAASLAVLRVSGRLQRCTVRLATAGRTCVVLSGLALPSAASPRFCLGFSLPPCVADESRVSAGALLRKAESLLRSREGSLALLQVVGGEGAGQALSRSLSAALRSTQPTSVAADLAPGRIGLLDEDTRKTTDPAALEEVLRAKGVQVTVVSHHLALTDHGLTSAQAARALRHAIGVFARQGTAGLRRSGFSDGLSGYLTQATAQAADLQRAIREQSFGLVYQPIVSLADRQVDHHEALIRPGRLTSAPKLTPQDFVMMIETVGMAEDLDRAVARRVCEVATVSGRPVSINLSSQSVQSPTFRQELVPLLERHRAAERGISVEMTETAEIDHIDEAALTAEALRRIGVSFALDDFGAGKAGIDVLRALKPDTVKLDGSYTEGLVKSSRERALFAGMVDLVHATGAPVVAERVETEREAAELVALGVRFGQGWLFGRAGPLPLSVSMPEPARRRLGETEV